MPSNFQVLVLPRRKYWSLLSCKHEKAILLLAIFLLLPLFVCVWCVCVCVCVCVCLRICLSKRFLSQPFVFYNCVHVIWYGKIAFFYLLLFNTSIIRETLFFLKFIICVKLEKYAKPTFPLCDISNKYCLTYKSVMFFMN